MTLLETVQNFLKTEKTQHKLDGSDDDAFTVEVYSHDDAKSLVAHLESAGFSAAFKSHVTFGPESHTVYCAKDEKGMSGLSDNQKMI